MRHWISVQIEQARPTLQFLVILLVMAASFFVWMSVMGCTDCDSDSYYSTSVNTGKDSAPLITVRGRIKCDSNSAYGGEKVSRQLQTHILVGEGPSTVTYTWTPPEGASGFVWYFGQQPENPEGPPPFVWKDVNPSETIDLEYTMPEVPPETGMTSATETLVTSYEGGNPGREQLTTGLFRSDSSQVTEDGAMLAHSVSRSVPDATTEDIEVWRAQRWYDPKGAALTTESCQNWIDLLKSDAVFFAVQAPVTSSGPITESQSLSLVMGDYTPGTVEIQVWGPAGTVYSAEVETRDERATFMTNELPAKEGAAWIALGLPDDAPACPAGLNAPANNWSILTNVAFDLRTLPDGGEGSHITGYMCYEGDELPLVDVAVSAAAKQAGVQLASYQGEGITCLGPQILTFGDSPAWQLEGASLVSGEISESVALHQAILRNSGAALSLTPEISSTLDVEWSLYYGTDSAPNLGQPIVSPFSMPMGYADFWLVSDALGAETPAGPHSVQLTLVNGALADDVQTIYDTVWVGDWVAPPGPPANPFLPLILR